MELRAEAIAPIEQPGSRSVGLAALWSGVSRGTEALVLAGAVPAAEQARMRAPFQEGAFPFPVKYGYALVARAVAAPGQEDLEGRAVFALHPHQDRAVLPAEAVLPLPDGLPPRRAVLAANAETALTVVWDAGAGPGDRILVVGAGVVGLLTAALAAAIPGTEVTVADRNPSRRAIAQALGAAFAAPDAVPGEQDVAINLSASGAGLQTALEALGDEGRAVEASWHGDRQVTLALGGAFHSRRLSVVSSQVGRLPPHRAPRWSHRRRLAKALDLLAAMPALDALIGPEIAFTAADRALPAHLAPGADALCVALRYPDHDQTAGET